MKKKKDGAYEIDLLHILKLLWSRVWLIALAAIIGIAAGFIVHHRTVKPVYRASTLLFVNNNALSISNGNYTISSGQLSSAAGLVDTYLVILKSRTTLEEVAEKAGVSYSYETLSNMISASSVNGTAIFRVTVTSSDPVMAKNLANVVADVLPHAISDIIENCSVRVVDRAVMPTGSISSSFTRYSMIGGALGAALVAAAVILLDMFDDVIRTGDYLTENYDLPVLAMIPDLLPENRSSHDYEYKSKYAYGYGYGYGAEKKNAVKGE